MTILILNVRIPLPNEVPGTEHLWPHVAALWHHFRAFAVSFLIVGSAWELHHHVFAKIVHVDRTITWLNLSLMGIVVMTPFSAALLGNFDENRTAIYVYGANVFIADCILLVMWLYIEKRALSESERQHSVPLTLHIVSRLVSLLIAVVVSILNPQFSLAALAFATLVSLISFRTRLHAVRT